MTVSNEGARKALRDEFEIWVAGFLRIATLEAVAHILRRNDADEYLDEQVGIQWESALWAYQRGLSGATALLAECLPWLETVQHIMGHGDDCDGCKAKALADSIRSKGGT